MFNTITRPFRVLADRLAGGNDLTFRDHLTVTKYVDEIETGRLNFVDATTKATEIIRKKGK